VRAEFRGCYFKRGERKRVEAKPAKKIVAQAEFDRALGRALHAYVQDER
jgi:hypothetical protein